MNYTYNMTHLSTHIYSEQELLTITPEQLYAFMANKLFGRPDPDYEVDKPTLGRSSSLAFTKKAISYFMPNKLMGWNQGTHQGNPTKSVLVNDLIKDVKKMEVRKEGKPSCARRAMIVGEYVEFIKTLRAKESNTYRHAIAAYFLFQYNMIARVDDVAHFMMADLTPSLDFDFALQSKMCWSKNVQEERDSPDQILLGANDPKFCVLLALAIHLEHGFKDGLLRSVDDDETALLFGVTKQTASKAMRDIVTSDGFVLRARGPLGTHSVRKFPATYARRNGCSKDDVDCRGRWKNNKRQVDTYIDVELPFADAKVAATLSIGGPIKYHYKEGSGLTDDWLLSNVSIQIGQRFPRRIGVVLGKALLWGIYDEEMNYLMEPAMVARVKNSFSNLRSNRLGIDINPIKKIPLVVSGDDDNFEIREIVGEDSEDESGEEEGSEEGTRRVRRRMNPTTGGVNDDLKDQVRILSSKVHSLRQVNEELKNEVKLFKVSTNSLLQQVNTSIRRLANVPVARPRVIQQVRVVPDVAGDDNGTVAGAGEDTNDGEGNIERNSYNTTLTKCPKSLHVLWREWEFGIGGRKAAKLFNSQERGRVKYNYSLRKGFWDLTNKMIRSGYTSDTAIDKIYSVYSTRLSVTKILQKIRDDKRIGGHPELS